jgi:hypothetical protein
VSPSVIAAATIGGAKDLHRRTRSPSGESNDLYVSNPLYEVAYEYQQQEQGQHQQQRRRTSHAEGGGAAIRPTELVGSSSSGASSGRASDEAATVRLSESTNNVCVDDFFGESTINKGGHTSRMRFLAKLQSECPRMVVQCNHRQYL